MKQSLRQRIPGKNYAGTDPVDLPSAEAIADIVTALKAWQPTDDNHANTLRQDRGEGAVAQQ
jgi:hypothetical protein